MLPHILLFMVASQWLVGLFLVMADCPKPQIGMRFKLEEEAYNFYNEYGRNAGFGIRRAYHHKSTEDPNVIVQRTYVCNKQGKRKESDIVRTIHRAETRTGCGAKMSISLQADGQYECKDFFEDHNHPLHTSNTVHLIRSQRAISSSQATEIDLAERAGIGTKFTFDLFSFQAGGNENVGFTKRDLHNYLNTKRQRDLAFGDAGSLILYFEKQRELNTAFVYYLQMDSEEKITNIFWADQGMQCDYELFGDVVIFDTTFCTNRENRPLAVFAGFNHHKTAVIFGAALLYDETVESFKWLFETFFRINGQKKPKTFFTNQDAAMTRAIAEVSPTTRHALCCWHLWQNAKKHHSYLMDEGSTFSKILQNCIWDYTEVDEFENAWKSLRENPRVQNTNWLDKAYKLKEKWACCYMHDVFTIGVRSTQLAESINADLKKCLKPSYDLIRFIEHFQYVVDAKRANELKEEFDARNTTLGSSQSMIGVVKQAFMAYTPNIFKKFMTEYELMLTYGVKSHSVSDLYAQYVISVANEFGHYTGKEYRISYNEAEGSMTCNCKKFERFGILCSHVLKLLDFLQIKCIPKRYILMRWMKGIRIFSLNDRREMEGIEVNGQLSRLQRYRMMTPIYLKLLNEACNTEAGFKILDDHANGIHQELQDVLAIEHVDHVAEESAETYTQLQLKRKKSQKGPDLYSHCSWSLPQGPEASKSSG